MSRKMMTRILCENFEKKMRKKKRWKKDLPSLIPREIFHIYVVNKESNGFQFFVQFGISLHLWVFKNLNLHEPLWRVQFQLLNNSAVQINSKLNTKPKDYLY